MKAKSLILIAIIFGIVACQGTGTTVGATTNRVDVGGGPMQPMTQGS